MDTLPQEAAASSVAITYQYPRRDTMGTLVAMKYPTTMMAKLADHTYVRCSTGGKAWGCWGGKTGGTSFNSGTGSTKRANAIAGGDEKAGIKCYLVNGVCHQAANRVLYPAGILVSEARGYTLSSLMFGTYGKVGIWPCKSPFDKHAGVSGDLSACIGESSDDDDDEDSGGKKIWTKLDFWFLRSVRSAYDRFNKSEHGALDNMKFSIGLFERELKLRLGDVSRKEYMGLLDAKETMEIQHSALTLHSRNTKMKSRDWSEFVQRFNHITVQFQQDMANTLSDKRYQQLLRLKRDETLLLADPDILRREFGDEVVRDVYGKR